jgi:hypothetical protein
MKSFWCISVMISVLFVSLEGTTDVVMDGVLHGDDVVHHSEFGYSLEDHDGSVTDSELNDDHCQHCCHGHSSTITSQVDSIVAPVLAGDRRVDNQIDVRNFAQAPPTPPPNA